MEKIYKRNWETEFYGLEFKDKRLKKRFFQVMEAISTSPDKSILCAAGTRISAKARPFHKNIFKYIPILYNK